MTTQCADRVVMPASAGSGVASRGFRRVLAWAQALWHTLQQQSQRRSEDRALRLLSDATLRDIGLAERVPQQPTLGVLDYERGRWQ